MGPLGRQASVQRLAKPPNIGKLMAQYPQKAIILHTFGVPMRSILGSIIRTYKKIQVLGFTVWRAGGGDRGILLIRNAEPR